MKKKILLPILFNIPLFLFLLNPVVNRFSNHGNSNVGAIAMMAIFAVLVLVTAPYTAPGEFICMSLFPVFYLNHRITCLLIACTLFWAIIGFLVGMYWDRLRERKVGG